MDRAHFLLILLVIVGGIAHGTPPDKASALRTNQPLLNQFEHLSVANGLSNNWVNCILQDHQGFMWFGTNDGLNKYDGYTFTVFQADARNPNHRHWNNPVSGLYEDHAHRLWAITSGGGLHEINSRTGRVTPHPIQSQPGGWKASGWRSSRWNYQHSIYEDHQHQLWISTLGGLAQYDPDRHRFTLYPLPRPEATIKTVFEDPQHRFWVGTYQGLYRFDPLTGRYTLIPVGNATDPQPAIMAFYLDAHQVLWMATATAGYSLLQINLKRTPWQPVRYNPGGQLNPFVYLNALHRDGQGFLWVGTTNGLHRIDPATNQIRTLHPDPTNPKSIGSNNMQAIYHDRAGTLWVGTDNGIDRQAVLPKTFVTYQVKPNVSPVNVPENRAVSVFMDQHGQLWQTDDYTVYRTELVANRPQAEGPRSVRVPPEVLGTVGDRKNAVYGFLDNGPSGIWIGSARGLYRYNQATNRYRLYPAEVPPEYVSWAPSGEIWLGGDLGIAAFNPQTGRYRYYRYRPNQPNSLPDQYVYGLLVDRSGMVWVLFRKQGAIRLNPRTGRYARYMAGTQGALTTNDITTLFEDQSGILWLGTQQGGLNRFDPQTGRFSAVTMQDGLLSNTILGIVGDQAGRLWLSTDKGLCRYHPGTKAVRTFKNNPDLPHHGFLRNAVSAYEDQLFFGSLDGVISVRPNQIRDDNHPLPVYITQWSAMNKARSLTDSVLTLGHDENFVSFSFSTLTYDQPEQVQYAYQLVGIDEKWVDNGNRNWASYTSLSPGRYTFRVKVANAAGIWSAKAASVRLIILPPWWQTGWAYTLYALLVIGTIWGSVRLYMNRIRQQQVLALNRREAAQLKAVDELKTRFFANITHEFRTPLSLILSSIEKILADYSVEKPVGQLLALVQRNAQHLQRLINQLLDLSKLEANRMTITPVWGDIASFVEHLVETLQLWAVQKEIHLSFAASEPMPEAFFDADKWEKILTNLLTNALKFTGQGGQVAIGLQPIWTDGSLQGVTIRLSDTGIGIAPEHLPHIFDRFYQRSADARSADAVDTSQTRAYEGTGIGLSLVNELVNLLEGTIRVESEPGVGTTFYLTLPVQLNERQTDSPDVFLAPKDLSPLQTPPDKTITTNIATEQAEQPLLLIVEDNTELREFLSTELGSDYRVMRASDGEEGWQLARTHLPELVISDVMMPRTDGYELTRRLKSNPETNHIGIILLTAKVALQNQMEGLQQGADAYLPKPFHLAELRLRVRNLLVYRQHLREQYRRQLAQPEHPAPIVENAFLQQVYALLDEHLSNPGLDVDWLADRLAMSRKTLYRKTHSLLQLAPNELIRQYRLRKAADLLRAGHPVAQTAYLVGFKTPSHFTTVFREFYEKTPSEFVHSNQ